jgi:hypothetical protein
MPCHTGKGKHMGAGHSAVADDEEDEKPTAATLAIRLKKAEAQAIILIDKFNTCPSASTGMFCSGGSSSGGGGSAGNPAAHAKAVAASKAAQESSDKANSPKRHRQAADAHADAAALHMQTGNNAKAEYHQGKMKAHNQAAEAKPTSAPYTGSRTPAAYNRVAATTAKPDIKQSHAAQAKQASQEADSASTHANNPSTKYKAEAHQSAAAAHGRAVEYQHQAGNAGLVASHSAKQKEHLAAAQHHPDTTPKPLNVFGFDKPRR